MKRNIKKLICFVLTLVMVLCSTSVAFAKEDKIPIILVHGVGGTPVYENVGTDEEKEIKTFGLGEVGDILKNTGLIGEALKLLSSETDVDTDALITKFHDMVEGNPFNCEPNGHVKAGQGVNNYWTTPMSKHKDFWQGAEKSELALIREICLMHGAKNVYAYNYDWRQDIYQSAKGLRKFVQAVKKRTGAKKVVLVGCSLGGSVLSCYMDAYKKKNDVSRYLFVNPAMCGVDVTRCYGLEFKITKKQVLKYLDGMQNANAGTSQPTILKVVKALGDKRVGIAAENLAKLSKNKAFIKRLSNEVILPWIGYVPALWECMPYDVFDNAVKKASAVGFLDKSSELYTMIKRYHKIQGRFKKNVKYLKKRKVQIAIIANYGQPGIPVTSKATNHIDGLIDTCRASAGATVANYGKKLKGKAAKGKYVSGDKVINAKTCLLPNSTWFIRDLQHMQFRRGTAAAKFIASMACGKAKYNLKAVKKKLGYGQFIASDENQNLTNI
ncbi:MAG: hypothetical protein K6C14_03735 [Eubacterium sp.]|nr:hypothetical protein [Eubacterium sp.]